jgi:nitrogen fixation protein FixH
VTDNLTPPPANEAAKRGAIFWPALIICLLVGHGLMIVTGVYIATRDRTFAIEPDYYQKGLHWDQIAQQQKENARLGWNVALELGSAVNVLGQRTVTCRLTNRLGNPLDGGQIDLVAFSHARGSDRLSAVLEPQGDGKYEAPVRITRKGTWEFRLMIRRGPDTFTLTEQRRM